MIQKTWIDSKGLVSREIHLQGLLAQSIYPRRVSKKTIACILNTYEIAMMKSIDEQKQTPKFLFKTQHILYAVSLVSFVLLFFFFTHLTLSTPFNMSDTEDGSQVCDNKFWHRKSCANRIFIGPWDIRATPASPSLSPEQIQPNTHDRSSSIISDSSMRLLNEWVVYQ